MFLSLRMQFHPLDIPTYPSELIILRIPPSLSLEISLNRDSHLQPPLT
jgi:hypothetical protein